MIYGAKEWYKREHHYSQRNNPEEEMLRKAKVKDWLETCGPTASVSCLAVKGCDLQIKCPGPFDPQPESVLADWFNDPRNYDILQTIRKGIKPEDWMGNRIPQYYPAAVIDVFGQHASFEWLAIELVRAFLKEGRPVQACLKRPSHYIAVVAYDTDKKEFIYNDSDTERAGLKNRGFNERISAAALAANMRPWGIAY